MKRNAALQTPVRLSAGPPATERDAFRRLEAVRTFDQLVTWSHDLRASNLLDLRGFSPEVRFWGCLWPGEVPPQAVPAGEGFRLPNGEVVKYVGDWQHGQWHRLAAAWEPAEVAA